MKKILVSLLLLASTAFASTSDTYQKMDPWYNLFTFSGSVSIHGNEDQVFVYESPYGHIYDGGAWGHEERMTIDLRRIRKDLGIVQNVPITFGMSYRTYPRDPYASSFQINRVETAIITPSIHGFVFEYNVHALSNSGRQGSACYLNAYYRSSFGLIDNPEINLISMSVSYCRTNGLGWIARPPAERGRDYSTLVWDQMFGTGYYWSPSKGYTFDITIDLRPVDFDAYVAFRTEHFWNEDPNWPKQYGQNYTMIGLTYGNAFEIGSDVTLQLEASMNKYADLDNPIFRGKAQLTLQTNFE